MTDGSGRSGYPDPRFDLRQLVYFLAVVDEGGVRKAAAALHVAQPSLSQTLRRLEESLGTALFHRLGRRLVLAPAGEALVGPARALLRQAETAGQAVEDVSRVRSGRVDIVSLSDVSADPLSAWVAQFRLEHPGIRFRIREHDRVADILESVTSGDTEIGLAPLPVSNDRVVSDLIVEQHFAVVAPPGTERDWPDRVGTARLGGVALVLGEPGTATRDFIERVLRERGVEPDIAVEIPHRGALLPTVVGGGGVTIVPLRVALDVRHRGAVVRMPAPPIVRQLGVLYRPGQMTPASARFIAYARRLLAEWHAAVERRMSDGLDEVEAAARTMAAIDRRIARRHTDAAPGSDQR